ncbi:type III-A CRISPR-associated RAMP protein Csm3 [Candidatus Magnetobacterium casense]|uniref:CRISPR system Cms endoribonuclease Csm3 n=1 Tax=Candidatus Magnetobacterium casense TaxID=1455061 RepID=A0ABS6RZB2_9BACT|nr:type III-A CRISPR-associated RAMP protein Csm3 [Candidatus Magnetobacterium casensis]MBV6341989.1 type III-A CRISPR-associated RAMP protein Csm3 [Candidatus Magnetobacterium casensis]
MELKLTEIKKLEGKITLKSGLHIGSGNAEMHIGGTDSPVIKHPHTLKPYIPGSSLKGKVRSLLEMESGLMVYTEGAVVSGKILEKVSDKGLKAKCTALLKVFGASADDASEEIGPTRASFADCYLDSEWLKTVQDNRWSLTEEKSENVINRIRGTAENPRFIERVPEGAVFNFLITFKVLAEDDKGLFESVLLRGLKLLEMDALGGSGSRGYGRIKIAFNDEGINGMFEELMPFNQGGGS